MTYSSSPRQNMETGMGYPELVQWPAMLVTIVASWFVSSSVQRRREIGFWLFLLSNVLWVLWGLHAQAHALVAMQVCLAVMNMRGRKKNAQ